tara:strand:- start:2622 stop:3866 length:1245 start_codon:yes stop_codon:yes gene_type:complete
MAEIVTMPRLSDTMTEGVVAKWHKQVGDAISEGDLLAEIETDKATMEFESFQEGVLLHIGVEEGGKAPVDSILAILGEKGEDVKSILKKLEKSVENEVSVSKKEKKEVKKDAPKKAAPKTVESKAVATTNVSDATNGNVKASPLAKKLAEERNINLSLIKGTGDGGRIIKRDIDNYSGGTAPAIERYTEVPISQMRGVIAQRLGESKFSAPHFYLTVEIDMANAIDARQAINGVSPVKVSFNDMIVKATSMSLQQHPEINSSWQGDTIRYNEHIHIGVAMAVEDGLLVPVIRFADTKRLSQIAAEVKDYGARAKAKTLQPEDWQENTFTISNLGMFNIEEFTAIINPPDACILAVGGIIEKPVVKNGQIVVGTTMKVTLSCDHRVVDGVVGSKFLATLKNYLENPVLFMGSQSI